VTIISSGSNVVSIVQPNTTNIVTCILTSGTTAASWSGGNVFVYTAGTSPYSICFDGTNIWVVSNGSNNVKKYAANTGTLLGTFSTGLGPDGVCFDGTNIWVSNGSQSTLTKLLASTGAVIGTYTVGSNPGGLCFDGTYIWVALNGGGAGTSVAKVLASTGALVGTYSTGSTGPVGICFDGTNIWVTNNGGGSGSINILSKLLASTGALIATYTVGIYPNSVCFDGTNIWVCNTGFGSGTTVTKLLASNGSLIGTYTLPVAPYGICFDGTNIWVSSLSSGVVTKLQASTGTNLGTYSVGTQPISVCFDGSNIWTANLGGANISKLTQLGIPPAPIGIPFLSTYDSISRDINANTYINNVIEGYETYATINTTYSVGTASQTTTTITGSGTNFTTAMIKGTIVYANLAQAPITAYVSSTSLTTTTSQTESAQAYTIYYGTSYNTGSVGQTTTVLTGVGTVFTPIMAGGWIIYSTGVVAQIVSFISSTVLTVTPSQTVSTGTSYILYYSTIQLSVLSGNQQFFTGFQNQLVTLPTASTLATGQNYTLTNNGTGTVTVVGTEFGTPGITISLLSGSYGNFMCIANIPLFYSTGTASQTTTAITGSGTTWTSAMVGGYIVYANLAIAPITAFVSSTASLTTTTSQTEAAQAYVIYYGTNYSTGTVGQSGITVTGSSTVFTSLMVGGWLVYTSGASSGVVVQVTGFTSTTSLTVSPAATVTAGASYSLYYQTTSNWSCTYSSPNAFSLSIVERDTNSNVALNNVNYNFTTTATAAGTTTLTVASSRIQYFSGSTTQTVVLPVVTTLVPGFTFEIVNISSGIVTLQNSALSTLATLVGSTYGFARCISTGASPNWSFEPGGTPVATL
jgi:hypothetical protein